MHDGLTISILNYNGKDVLSACLDSIFSQSYEGPRSVQIIDNGTTDGSGELAFKEYKEVDWLVQASNEHQFITGLNESFRANKFPKTLFVSNDCVLQQGAIAELLLTYERYSKSIIQPAFYWHDGRPQNIGMNWIWPGYGIARKEGTVFGPVSETPILTTTCFLISKEAFTEIGPFDTNLAPGHYEDVDYSFRAKKLGYRLLVAQEAKVSHIGGHSFNKVYGKRGISKAGHKNRIYTVRKHYSGWRRISMVLGIYVLDSLIHAVRPLYNVLALLSNKTKEGHT